MTSDMWGGHGRNQDSDSEGKEPLASGCHLFYSSFYDSPMYGYNLTDPGKWTELPPPPKAIKISKVSFWGSDILVLDGTPSFPSYNQAKQQSS